PGVDAAMARSALGDSGVWARSHSCGPLRGGRAGRFRRLLRRHGRCSVKANGSRLSPLPPVGSGLPRSSAVSSSDESRGCSHGGGRQSIRRPNPLCRAREPETGPVDARAQRARAGRNARRRRCVRFPCRGKTASAPLVAGMRLGVAVPPGDRTAPAVAPVFNAESQVRSSRAGTALARAHIMSTAAQPAIAVRTLPAGRWAGPAILAADIAALEIAFVLGLALRRILSGWLPAYVGFDQYAGIAAGILFLPIINYQIGLY